MNIPSLLQITTSLAIFCLLSSCHSESGDNSAENPLSECEVIATREIIHGDTVINCHIGKADRDKTMMIPLSMLIDSLEIVRLDSTDDALVGGTVSAIFQTIISLYRNSVKHRSYSGATANMSSNWVP